MPLSRAWLAPADALTRTASVRTQRIPVNQGALVEVHHALGIFGSLGIVGDHHHGLAELGVQSLQQGEDLVGGLAVEIAGGLVADQDARVGNERTRDRDALLLICDEPTGDLDRKTADEILTLLQVLNREHGKTIVMVTHDPKAAEFARRTLHLEKGQLLEQAAA